MKLQLKSIVDFVPRERLAWVFFHEGDRTFPVYAPLLFISWDAMMGGNFGIVPAFFGQTTETEGVAQNSYSFSVYLNLPSAARLWAQCWKHHNLGLDVAWDGGIGNDFLFALGGSANIQPLSHPGYRTAIPAGRFRVNHEVISHLIAGNHKGIVGGQSPSAPTSTGACDGQ